MPRPWRTCCAPTCWPRPGSLRPTPGRPAGWSAPGLGWSGCGHGCNSQLHALLADLGVIPELTTLFGPAGRRWLAELGMPASARGRLDAGLRLIDAITVEVAHADADLRACFAGDHRVRRLLPIPGVGLVTAATVVAEVWDIQRFPAPERLCSWAGLTPGERTSDAHTRRGHITKQGSRWLRWMLVEAATTAVRDPQLGRFTAQIARRRGPKIARVALARRLLTLCYYALRDDGGCRAYPVLTR
jgi:transposase